jgi:hypothetical protein
MTATRGIGRWATVVVLSAAWLVGAYFLWRTSVPSSLDVGGLDVHRFFSARELRRAADYQRFVTRLDDAITSQHHEVTVRQSGAAQQQQVLQQAQQRLLAFDTLARRHARQQATRELRREQHQADEFAARASARAQDRQP